MGYYDGTKLLSLKDLSGRDPEIVMCTTNRTGGKTTFFNRLMVRRYLERAMKFCLFYRYDYEVVESPDSFWKDIGPMFFKKHDFDAIKRYKGKFMEFFLDSQSCGYAVALNSADKIRKISHFFSDTDEILFDEFQPESNIYLPNEIQKFRSLHTSIARGQGKQVRFVPVYMCANPITILNPYYTAFGVAKRLRKDTKFLRGNGWVLEDGFVESAAEAQKDSGFNRAFENDDYGKILAESTYLLDNLSFIEHMTGRSMYLFTFVYNGKSYAVREFSDKGLYYVDDRVDFDCKNKIVITTADHNINYIMLDRNEPMLSMLRKFFHLGLFRFRSPEAKEATLAMLAVY